MIMDYHISFIYKLYIHSINKYLLGKGELIFQGLEIITKKKKKRSKEFKLQNCI